MTSPPEVTPPTRPASWNDLRWREQAPVRWFSPRVLAGSGARVLLSSLFGSWFDKRELQASLGDTIFDQHKDRTDGLWIDYIADTGDGFDPTYTVAWLAAQPGLCVDDAGAPLQRGDLLVLGGDEVYPVASAAAYEQRFKEPFRASLPWTEPPNPELFAVPGNHDWYDGLTSFLRVFAQQEWIGGRRTVQERSYFALQLPHRWWLWGVDVQFDAYVDAPQVRYFEKVAAAMHDGDRVILCVATPSWVDLPTNPDAYRNIAFLERRLLAPKNASVVLTLSGDLHHYARYCGADGGQRVTAGGGGAFLHPTHNLPTEITTSIDADDSSVGTVQHELVRRYPSPSESRRLLWGSVGLPFRNPSFAALLGLVHVVLLWVDQFALRLLERPADAVDEAASTWSFRDLLEGLFRDPFSLALLIVFGGTLIVFAKPPPVVRYGLARLAIRVLMGLIHGAAHVVAVAFAAFMAINLVDGALAGFWFAVLVTVVAFVVGGIASGMVFGAYLGASNMPRWGTHGNEAFSAMRRTRYKGFVRLHITADGGLRVWAIGIDRVCKRWSFDPSAPNEKPWLEPSKGAAPTGRVIDHFALPAIELDRATTRRQSRFDDSALPEQRRT